MSVGAINFSGLASGINTASIIQELVSITKQPEKLLQDQETQIQATQAAYGTVSASLIQFQTAAAALDNLNSFNLVTSNSSDTSVATVSSQSGASTGTHTIDVSNLATAQELTSTAQTSETAPLGYNGQIVVNGTAINVSSADSLESLASNINSVDTGVTASIISPTQGQYYLTLQSNNTGLQGQISISDTGGDSFLSNTLGILGTTGTTLANPLGPTATPTGAGSGLFSDSSTSIATLEGLTNPASGTVQITNGQGQSASVNIDLGTDSLSSIAANINSASLSGVTASVATVTNPFSGASQQQLQINGATNFTDSNNVLANLGVTQSSLAKGAQLEQAQNANFTLDGLTASQPTNSFSSAISGLTVNLVGTGTTTLSVSPDTTTIASNINAFVTAYNSTVNSITSQATYDSTSGTTGTLFGDSTTQSILNDLVTNVTSPVAGAPPSLSLLSQIGITLDPSGDDQLDVNTQTLDAAIQNNLQGVAKLFQAQGSATNPDVQYVSSTADTQPSGPAGYAIDVTSPATQATITSSTTLTAPLGQQEVLTFGGALFPTSSTGTGGGTSITLQAGSTLQDIVNQINDDSAVGGQLSASITNGALTFTSKQYGSAEQFTVTSGVSSDTANSTGIGTAGLTAAGTDVQGTINGETSTGSGQFLSDTQTNASDGVNGTAYGLQVRVTATTPGLYGTVNFTSGVADFVNNYVNQQTDPISGVLTLATSALNDQITNINNSITQIEAEATAQEQELQTEFDNAETAISQLKANGAGLDALLGTTASSSTVGSGSGSSGNGSSSTGSTGSVNSSSSSGNSSSSAGNSS